CAPEPSPETPTYLIIKFGHGGRGHRVTSMARHAEKLALVAGRSPSTLWDEDRKKPRVTSLSVGHFPIGRAIVRADGRDHARTSEAAPARGLAPDRVLRRGRRRPTADRRR